MHVQATLLRDHIAMSDRDHFLAAIRSAPDEDLPRLVMADWLDENGESERAELIRLQIQLHHWSKNADLDLPDGSVMRENELGVQFWKSMAPDDGRVDFRDDRGFVVYVACPFADWVTHAPRILPESVGLTVRLTDRPTLRHAVRPGDDSRYVILEGTQDKGGMAWKIPAGCQSIPVGQQEAIIDGLLRGNWPEVAAWELPPMGGGFILPRSFMRELADRNPQAAADLVATQNISVYGE